MAALRKPYWRSEDARDVLAVWRRSGMTLTAFVRQHGLGRDRLARWRRRLDGDAKVRFHPVQVVGSSSLNPAAAETAIEIVPGRPRRVVVRPGFDAEHLMAVLAALEPPGC